MHHTAKPYARIGLLATLSSLDKRCSANLNGKATSSFGNSRLTPIPTETALGPMHSRSFHFIFSRRPSFYWTAGCCYILPPLYQIPGSADENLPELSRNSICTCFPLLFFALPPTNSRQATFLALCRRGTTDSPYFSCRKGNTSLLDSRDGKRQRCKGYQRRSRGR